MPGEKMSEAENVVLFDGVCNLCHGAVNFIIDRDPDRLYRFASLQSDAGRSILARYNVDPTRTDSVVLVRNNKAYAKSRAALEITRKLSGLWPILYIFIVVPPFISDVVYDFVARNRYRWFGRQESCRMPGPELKHRFIG